MVGLSWESSKGFLASFHSDYPLIQSDKSTIISLISFHNDYNFFLESFLHDKSVNDTQNELQASLCALNMTIECTCMFSNG